MITGLSRVTTIIPGYKMFLSGHKLLFQAGLTYPNNTETIPKHHINKPEQHRNTLERAGTPLNT